MKEINIKKIKQNKSVEELLEFGILNIDKPSGPTSFKTSEFVKKELNLRKTSHFGTLDPKVTGVLPVALNRACKLSGYFIEKEKTYVGIMRFHEEISLEKVQNKIKEKFLGKIMQTPPVKSRVKRQSRQREIFKFEIIEKNKKDFLFKTKVEAGTYIRKLIDDLGKELEIGAHMLELRRTHAGIFSEQDLEFLNLYELERAIEQHENGDSELIKKYIIPGEIISEIYPVVQIKKNNLKQIFTGKPIKTSDIKNKEDLKKNKNEIICIFQKDKFIGMYKTILGEDIFAKPEFVMQPIN